MNVEPDIKDQHQQIEHCESDDEGNSERPVFDDKEEHYDHQYS